MTIPSRPAPAPPGSRDINAAAGANASLEQMRQQQQQQQHSHTQQQKGGVQMLTIKLPPPPAPNGRNATGTPLGNGLLQKNYSNNSNNNSKRMNQSNNNRNNNNGSSITRKFPSANIRYAPATSWDGSPFESANAIRTENRSAGALSKKMPPPRPPPPKVLPNHRKAGAAPAPPQSINILNNIFSRKKSAKAPAPHAVPSRALKRTDVGMNTLLTVQQLGGSSTATVGDSSNPNNWSSCNAAPLLSLAANTPHLQQQKAQPQQQEPQLISFDSPPSSPTFTQKSNSDCLSVDSFSSDSNFSSPNNGSASQPESGFEDDFSARSGAPPTMSPLDPWERVDAFSSNASGSSFFNAKGTAGAPIGSAPVRNFSTINTRIHSSADNPLCNGRSLLPPAPSLAQPTVIKPKLSQKPKAPKPPPAWNTNTINSNSKNSTNAENRLMMPISSMPQFGAPASLLDVISGKADALQLLPNLSSGDSLSGEAPYGIALYNFDGTEDGDLSFRENERIYLMEQINEEWYRGRTRSGCEGIFPANYIDIKVPLKASAVAEATLSSNQSTFQTKIPRNTLNQDFPKVKCLYNFAAEVEGDLALNEDDMVTILYRINDDWLFGEVNGRQGQFPANFLEHNV